MVSGGEPLRITLILTEAEIELCPSRLIKADVEERVGLPAVHWHCIGPAFCLGLTTALTGHIKKTQCLILRICHGFVVRPGRR